MPQIVRSVPARPARLAGFPHSVYFLKIQTHEGFTVLCGCLAHLTICPGGK
ncbi:MAG: hypothetical protein JWO71_2773 [Candidatus Acidoferrum typicum]|nr:hypothetical protein [Candidatus Acidoferrum typicum]